MTEEILVPNGLAVILEELCSRERGLEHDIAVMQQELERVRGKVAALREAMANKNPAGEGGAEG